MLQGFQRVGEGFGEKDLDALMTVHSDHYRYQDLTKEGLRKIWTGLF